MSVTEMDADRRGRTVEIVINGTEVEVDEKELTFERLVELADLQQSGDLEYSIKYSRGPGASTGLLLPGQSIKIKKGMRFVVKATVRS